MIRHVSIFRLKPGADIAALDRAIAQVKALKLGGVRAFAHGRDAGLRDGNAAYAVVVDFADAASYQAWDRDPGHERIRRELVQPLVDRVERVQLTLPDG